MNCLPGEGVGRRQEPGMRKALRLNPLHKLPFKAKLAVSRHMRPAGAPVPRPSMLEYRKHVCTGEARDVPNCFADRRAWSFGQEMIEQRNGAANAAKYSVASIAGKMRIDRHF